MVRVKRGNVARNRRKKILKFAKGFNGAHSRLFRTANGQVMKALIYSYVGRKRRKQDFKKLWSSYIKILKQRNEALKTKDSSENMWVEKLASAGEEISTMREKYVSRLQTKLNETGNYIMPNQELNFVYERG